MVAPILGVEMQLAQSRVGKTLLSRIMLPPTLASFSTSQYLVAHVAQLEGGFHAADAATYDHGVVSSRPVAGTHGIACGTGHVGAHTATASAGPMSPRVRANSCM